MKKLLLILTMLVSVCGFATAAEPDAVRVKPVGGDAILLQFTANPQVAYTTMMPPLFCTVALARPFLARYSAFSGRLVSSARGISSLASSCGTVSVHV